MRGAHARVLPFVLALALPGGCANDAARRTAGADRPAFLGVDDFGDTIRLGAGARRIVSLNPTTTEILFALGAGDRLVGRSEFDRWPAAALAVASIGPALRPNVEAVLGAKPDLVLLYASRDNHAAAQQLRAAGIQTAAFKVDSIEQFDRLTRLLGHIVGDSTRGALVADTVRRTLDSVRAVTQGLAPVSVVMPSWDQPLIVIGGGSFLSQLVTIAGGRNVYDSIASPSPTVTLEDVVRRNPDVVLVGPERSANIRGDARWRVLPAVRSGRVLVIDTNVTMRPAVRLGEGAVALARLLHPELARP
jgi:ABC-type Fe3+-hydroxamate transport system substrate-binding protein